VIPWRRRRQRHLAQKVGADLMAEPARPAMDADDDIATGETEALRDGIVRDCRDLLHFEVVVARAQGAHLLALALACAMRDRIGLGARHRASFLDAIEILGAPVTLCNRPLRAAFEHAVHLDLVERDLSRAAHTGRDRPEQAVRQCLFAARQIIGLETGQ